MNLYKFNFDLAGSSNAVQTITIPTDSKYSMGLKFFKGSEELVIGDDVKITIQDDKYIYTPTEIFNNYAVFAGATGSDAGESKTYQVNFHKDGSEPELVYNRTTKQTSGTASPTVNFVCKYITDYNIGNIEDFRPDRIFISYLMNGEESDRPDKKNMRSVLTEYPFESICNTTGEINSSNWSKFGGFYMPNGSYRYYRAVWCKAGDKYGWILFDNRTLAGNPITITEDKFLKGDVYDIPEIKDSIFSYKKMVPGLHRQGEWLSIDWYYGEDKAAVDANFKGVNVKTNDSNISNWAITDSQMKVVYTDEWEEMKDNADDRVIYFVVDRPTPPKPVPPKPTPGGDVKWGVLIGEVEESATFDPTNIADCLEAYPGKFVKYTRDGIDYYLQLDVKSSTSAEKREEEDAVRVDQISLMWQEYLEDDIHLQLETMYVKDGQLNVNSFNKHFNTEDEMYDYEDNYYFSRFGEDGDQPNTSNPIPADFDTWEIVDEYAESLPITNETDEYVYLEGIEDVIPPMKLFKNMDTFVQWKLVGPA